MQEITERLKKIKYQMLKEYKEEYSADQKIPMAQSIYDAAINDDTPDMTGDTFPSEALGLTLEWSTDRRTVTIGGGAYEITDDLTDDVIPHLDDELLPGAFQTNGEFFKINNDIFELKTA